MRTLPNYAFFDFDKTLIYKDSFVLLVKTGLKQQPWRILFLVLFSPIFLMAVLFKWDKAFAKSFLLWSLTVFRGKKGSIAFLKRFVSQSVDPIWFAQAIPELEKLRGHGVEIVVISASGNCWLREALRHKFCNLRMIIGSKLGFFAGGIIYKSKNCYRDEKIKRIYEILGKDFIWHSSYSDHIADLPLLKLAPKRYIVCPIKSHLKIFQTQLKDNSTVLNWSASSRDLRNPVKL